MYPSTCLISNATLTLQAAVCTLPVSASHSTRRSAAQHMPLARALGAIDGHQSSVGCDGACGWLVTKYPSNVGYGCTSSLRRSVLNFYPISEQIVQPMYPRLSIHLPRYVCVRGMESRIAATWPNDSRVPELPFLSWVYCCSEHRHHCQYSRCLVCSTMWAGPREWALGTGG